MTYLTGSEQYKYCIKPYFMHVFCVGVDVRMLLFFLYQFRCVCPHLQLKRQHFVSVVSIDSGMSLWAHSTQQQYCS